MTRTDEYWWNPFRGDAWDENRWSDCVRLDPVGARRALEGLRAVFPLRTLAGINAMSHPLGIDYSIAWNRWRLLEVGAILAELDATTVAEYRTRLAEATEYVGACAELQAGLLLRRLGFALRRDPANEVRQADGRRIPGPEFRAWQEERALGVEVKCLEPSKRTLGQRTAAVEALFAFGPLLPSGVGVEGTLNPDVFAEVTNGKWVDKKRLGELALDAAVALEEGGVAQTALGAFRASESGQSSVRGAAADHAYEAERLRSRLQKAAVQLAAIPEPGLILLSAARDYELLFRADAIAAALHEEWARSIAAVVIIMPTLPGFALLPIRGARFADLRPFRFENVRVCEKRHLHVDTFAFRRACEVI